MNICIQYTAWYHNTGVKNKHAMVKRDWGCLLATTRIIGRENRDSRGGTVTFLSDIVGYFVLRIKEKRGKKGKDLFVHPHEKKVISTRELLIKIVVEDY